MTAPGVVGDSFPKRPRNGRDDVIETLDRAASNFRDGHTTGFETIERLVSPDLAYTLEIERFVAKVGGSSRASRHPPAFRSEGGEWLHSATTG